MKVERPNKWFACIALAWILGPGFRSPGSAHYASSRGCLKFRTISALALCRGRGHARGGDAGVQPLHEGGERIIRCTACVLQTWVGGQLRLATLCVRNRLLFAVAVVLVGGGSGYIMLLLRTH